MPKDSITKPDNFLADTVNAKRRRFGYVDGFRFGLGFFVAGLLLTVIVGGLAWALVAYGHVH
jgi:hypothetical protein